MISKDKKRPSRWVRFVRKRIPIVSWVQNYSGEKAISDLIAGVTVGLTLMPQGLAYATLAGLEPQVCTVYFDKYIIIQREYCDGSEK